MTFKELHAVIRLLDQCQYKFVLNDYSHLSTHILEYNKKEELWEFYLLDERGGKSDFKTFSTEEEACEHVLNAAIESIKTFRDAYMDAVKRKYIGVLS